MNAAGVTTKVVLVSAAGRPPADIPATVTVIAQADILDGAIEDV